MADEERAAKAARAKAMLAKRRQKAAGSAPAISPPPTGPASETSRSSTPVRGTKSPPPPSSVVVPPPPLAAPSSAPHSPQHRDASSLFGGDGAANGNVDFGEFGVLSHPMSPSKQPHAHLPTSPVPQTASTTPPSQINQDFRSLQRRHILLSSELTDLRTELNHSRARETHIRGDMRVLEDELTGLHEAARKSNHLEAQYGELREQNASLQTVHDHLQRAHDELKKQGDDLSFQLKEVQQERDTFVKTTEELRASLLSLHQERDASRDRFDVLKNDCEEMGQLIEHQKQTIALLVDEKASLSSHVEELEELQTKYPDLTSQLVSSQTLVKSVAERLKASEKDRELISMKLEEIESKERSASDRAREKELSLEDSRQSILDLRGRLETAERELRTLQEDDRAETLERSLKSAQERGSELQIQLGKLKQNLATATQDRIVLSQTVQELQATTQSLQEQTTTLQSELTSVRSERDALVTTLSNTTTSHTTLHSQLDTAQSTITTLQSRISMLSADVASSSRQLKESQTALSASTSLVDDAQSSQKELQRENSALLAQLEELKRKVVEIVDKSAEDQEVISRGQSRLKEVEEVVARLEVQVDEKKREAESAHERVGEWEGEVRRVKKDWEAEVGGLKDELREVQAAYETVMSAVAMWRQRAEKAERETKEIRGAVDEVARLQREIERWKGEAGEVRQLLAGSMEDEEEAAGVVRRAQAEVESLREQLVSKEDELARLHDEVEELKSDSPSPRPRGHRVAQPSLNDELLSNLRHHHALELSTAHSRIRELESAVFDAQAQAHTLQKRITSLEDESASISQHHHPSRLGSPKPVSASFLRDQSDSASSSRRQSLSSTRPHTPMSLRRHVIQRPVYEENLSTETRQKRKLSLSMLKARIESEREAAAATASLSTAVNSPKLSVPPLTGLAREVISEVDEPFSQEVIVRSARSPGTTTSSSVTGLSGGAAKKVHAVHLGGILDESHVFWCHSCKGELVVL